MSRRLTSIIHSSLKDYYLLRLVCLHTFCVEWWHFNLWVAARGGNCAFKKPSFLVFLEKPKKPKKLKI